LTNSSSGVITPFAKSRFMRSMAAREFMPGRFPSSDVITGLLCGAPMEFTQVRLWRVLCAAFIH
jgi:hypothetical protein